MTITVFDFLFWEATVLQKKPKSEGSGWEANCDECSESLDLEDAIGWDAALSDFRAAGWRSVQKDGVWSHLCPTCYEAHLAKRRGTS
jgi:hypothetical protein